MHARNVFPLLLLLAVSAVGAALPERQASRPGGPINPADVAWMLTATGLVLLMTPGLSFFYGGMVGRRNVISTMLQSFGLRPAIT
jgi:Amt family ammonium transporter